MAHSAAAVVAHAPLRLSMLVMGDSVDRDIAWAASSDLADPTPFLEPDQLVLTTGRQFADFDDSDFDAYVTRLSDAGAVGIGFGTEVLRDGVPEPLLAACRAARMTLFEVPYRTPFLAIIRWVAGQIEREVRRRDEWALESLRAVSTAALAGTVEAPLAVLAHRIGGSVLLVGSGGAVGEPIGSLTPSMATREALADEARRVLGLGRRGGRELEVGEGVATLQTLGAGGRLSGVIVLVADERLDRAARLVLTAVVALLEVSAHHDDRADDLRRRLGASAVEAAIAGQRDVVRLLAEATSGRMPDPPLIVTASVFDTAGEESAARAAFDEGSAVSGTVDGTLLAIAAGPSWRRRVSAIGGRTGVVTGVAWEGVAAAVERAKEALRRTSAAVPVVLWEPTEGRALDAALAAPTVVSFAAAALAVIRADEHGEELLRYAEVWLQQDGRWDSSASILGLHRHSLKARIRRLGALLGLDLETFAGRVELHLILSAASE
jgi:PucR family transcriptional regulator, purine catabolism regulatory protein